MALRPGITGFVVFGPGQEILERCLSSMAPAVDEIVAIDTGADPQTRGVAERFNARIYDMAWPDSFAEAYNFAIEKVETEWSLWLDSDEWLEEDAAAKVREGMADKRALAFHLIREDFYGPNSSSEMFQLRMWRTSPYLRLRGHIHAHFPEIALRTASMGRVIKASTIRIYHDGFMGGISEAKLERNLKYLERELAERPGQLYFEICMAETLRSLGRPEGNKMVRKIVDAHLDSEQASAPQALLSALFAIDLKDLPDEELLTPRTNKLIRLAWRWFAKSPTVVWTIAEVELRRDNILLAYHALLELEELSRGGYDRLYSFDPEVFGKGLYINLAQSAGLLGKRTVFERAVEKLRALSPEDAEKMTNALA